MQAPQQIGAFEGALLDTMLSVSEDNCMKTQAEHRRIRIWMLAISIIALAVVILWRLPANRFMSQVADALLVAGLLALLVDPFLKRDLLIEASRGIFIHLLGFEHHPALKDKLKEIIFETKLLRSELRQVVTVEPANEGFWVTVEYEADVVNPTNTPVQYGPSIEWDMAHKPRVLRLALTSSDGKAKWTEREIQLRESEPGVQIAKPHQVSLRPGVTCHVSGEYQLFSKHGYLITYMGRPTLKMSVRLNTPDDYEYSATRADIQNSNYWEYNSILMKGDHVTVRWRKRGGEWL